MLLKKMITHFTIMLLLLSNKIFSCKTDKISTLKKPALENVLQFLDLNDLLNFCLLSQNLNQFYRELSNTLVKHSHASGLIEFYPVDNETTEQIGIKLPYFIKLVHRFQNQRLVHYRFNEKQTVLFECRADKLSRFTKESLQDIAKWAIETSVEYLFQNSPTTDRLEKILNNFCPNTLLFHEFEYSEDERVDNLLVFNNIAFTWSKIDDLPFLCPLLWITADSFFFKLKAHPLFLGIYSEGKNIAVLIGGNKLKFIPVDIVKKRQKEILDGTLELDIDSLKDEDHFASRPILDSFIVNTF